MTFADLIYKTWNACAAHKTKLVGIATGALAYTASQHWISPSVADGCLYASGMLTILCGLSNTTAIAEKLALRAPLPNVEAAQPPKEIP